MGFDPNTWQVTDLFYVPGHFMTPAVVEKRKPLSSNARRSGWVGSNIRLNRIPDAGQIEIVEGGRAVPPAEVRTKFEQTAFLSEKDAEERSWTTAVMDCIDELNVQAGEQFELADVYDFEDRLTEMYPENQHVRAKIRQQLQVLRDEGLVDYLGDGKYRLRWIDDRDFP